MPVGILAVGKTEVFFMHVCVGVTIFYITHQSALLSCVCKCSRGKEKVS